MRLTTISTGPLFKRLGLASAHRLWEDFSKMSLHPAEIAKEIKAYPFFSSFDESLLLQVSTLVREVEFPAGETILSAGQMNEKLYFLRQGVVEVLVDNERVNELALIGDVLGEMSALSGKPVSADLKARTAIKCFMINADDFTHVQPSQKDRFQFLLYRIYAGILTDRLKKTNEKAKMYEITARELATAKRELELVSSAQMNFLRSEAQMPQQKVLLIEAAKKQQNIVKTAVGGTGMHLEIASTADEAKELLAKTKFDVLFCDESSAELLGSEDMKSFQGQIVFLQSLDLNFDLLMKLPFVHNVISRDPEDRAGTVKSLLTTLTKILHGDYFGLEKYLAWGTDVKSQKVQSSTDRESLREAMLTHFRDLGLRGSLLDRVQVAAEEMMMNAVYDAPTDGNGKPLYNHLPRTTEVRLSPEQQATLRFGCDGNMLAISVEDPFGALSKETVLKYLQSCYAGAAGSLNTGKGGAGRGLHQILESCDFSIFNVKPGGKTEVIGVFDIEAAIQKRDSRPRFHFFFVK